MTASASPASAWTTEETANDKEVGRWACGKCGKMVVAAGRPSPKFLGSGAFAGHCPWECGAWINRSFRHIRSGEVRIFRSAEWDDRALPAA